MLGRVNGGKIIDGSKEGKDIDVQRSRTHIAAHWNAFEDLESDVSKATWCAGSSSGFCDLVKETPLSPTSTSVCQVLIEPIKNGQRYFITVRATNSAGVTTSITSDGVVVDDTPPTSGTVIDGVDSDVDYLNGEDDIRARWFGFQDSESGIDSYEVALCDARNLSFCPQPFSGVGLATNLSITGKIYFLEIYDIRTKLINFTKEVEKHRFLATHWLDTNDPTVLGEYKAR